MKLPPLFTFNREVVHGDDGVVLSFTFGGVLVALAEIMILSLIVSFAVGLLRAARRRASRSHY